MLSKMMLARSNVLLFDEPTNHLDMESITALADGMLNFKGSIVFSSYDQHLIENVANRVIKINDDGTIIDTELNYEEFVKKYGKN